jgi:hypothetical protein
MLKQAPEAVVVQSGRTPAEKEPQPDFAMFRYSYWNSRSLHFGRDDANEMTRMMDRTLSNIVLVVLVLSFLSEVVDFFCVHCLPSVSLFDERDFLLGIGWGPMALVDEESARRGWPGWRRCLQPQMGEGAVIEARLEAGGATARDLLRLVEAAGVVAPVAAFITAAPAAVATRSYYPIRTEKFL